MSFGNKLRELRKSSNFTQDDLAKKLSLSKANISKYEADFVEPNFQTLATISNLFDVSTDYLLGLSSSPKTFKEPIISNFEHKLIDAYRKQSELQPAVNKLLGVDPVQIITNKKGEKTVVVIEAMTPNRTSDLRIAAESPSEGKSVKRTNKRKLSPEEI